MSQLIQWSRSGGEMGESLFNPLRLRLARRRRGLSKVKLARKAELTTRSVYDFESGKQRPADDTASRLADSLEFPVSFFFRGDIEEPSPVVASFRSLKAMTAGERDAALAAGALAFELSDWIESRFELEPIDLPDLQDYGPEAAAMALRSRWRIGERPIGHMVNLLESKGVRVFSLAQEGNRVDAFSLWHREKPFVFLNTMKTAEHSRLDAAHELGHLILHRHGAPRGRDLEKDAQLFASSFLMPRGSVLATAPRAVVGGLERLIALKQVWKVSVAALAHRLHALGVLSDWNYRTVCIQLAALGKSNEPAGIPRETSTSLGLIFGDLRDAGVSTADVARALNLYTRDVEALIFGLSIGTVAEGSKSSSEDLDATTRRKAFRVLG